MAAFKVGESTVESGAHYFADVVGMRGPPRAASSCRRAACASSCRPTTTRDITKRVEYGPPFRPHDPTYQIDRGLFENELAARARGAGVDVFGRAAGSRRSSSATTVHSVTFDRGWAATARPSRPAGWSTRPGGASSAEAQARARRRRSGTPSTRPGSGSRAGSTSRSGARTTRSGWAGWPSRGLRQAQHQPPARRGLLGLADPARHRARSASASCADPRVPPVRGDRQPRADRSTGCTEHEPQLAAVVENRARRRRGLPPRRALRLRLRAGLLARPLVRASARRAPSPTRFSRPAPTSSAWQLVHHAT